MKKKLSLLIAALFMLFAIPLLGGCAVDPWETHWVLSSYTKDGETYSTQFDDMDYFAIVPIDLVQIVFHEDKTFTFTDYQGTMSEGAFTYRNAAEKSFVTLTFTNGETAEGWCAKYPWGMTYKAYFEIDGVEYYFTDDRGHGDDPLESGLVREGERLKEADTYFTYHAEDNRYSSYYYRGILEFADGVYFLTKLDKNGEYFRYNLSRPDEEGDGYYSYTVYEYDKEFTFTETELRTDECIVKYAYYGERFVIYYRGASWAEEAIS